MSVRLITHCYAGLHPEYAALLRYQLSSLVAFPADCDVAIAVCYCPEDSLTVSVLEEFRDRPEFGLALYSFDKPALFRRCIGRDLAAIESCEDTVWFTDCDHYFGSGCLDRADTILKAAPDTTAMIYPRYIQASTVKQPTEELVQAGMQGTVPLTINPEDFSPKLYRKPIGGVQIVRGTTARKLGYLGGTKWHTFLKDPVFSDFRDDGAYRNLIAKTGEITPVDIPELYRIRHQCKTHEG